MTGCSQDGSCPHPLPLTDQEGCLSWGPPIPANQWQEARQGAWQTALSQSAARRGPHDRQASQPRNSKGWGHWSEAWEPCHGNGSQPHNMLAKKSAACLLDLGRSLIITVKLSQLWIYSFKYFENTLNNGHWGRGRRGFLCLSISSEYSLSALLDFTLLIEAKNFSATWNWSCEVSTVPGSVFQICRDEGQVIKKGY